MHISGPGIHHGVGLGGLQFTLYIEVVKVEEEVVLIAKSSS